MTEGSMFVVSICTAVEKHGGGGMEGGGQCGSEQYGCGCGCFWRLARHPLLLDAYTDKV